MCRSDLASYCDLERRKETITSFVVQNNRYEMSAFYFGPNTFKAFLKGENFQLEGRDRIFWNRDRIFRSRSNFYRKTDLDFKIPI